MSVGATGVISASANIDAKRMVLMVDSILNDDYTRAMELHYEMVELIRALFIESEYAFEHWTEDKPACKFIGYEYCEIPFDSQIITDFSWYTPLHYFLNKLNGYGLFDGIDEAEEFKKKYDEEFEKGNIGDGEMDTFICRISEIDLNLL